MPTTSEDRAQTSSEAKPPGHRILSRKDHPHPLRSKRSSNPIQWRGSFFDQVGQRNYKTKLGVTENEVAGKTSSD
jgi:hypothetical protein